MCQTSFTDQGRRSVVTEQTTVATVSIDGAGVELDYWDSFYRAGGPNRTPSTFAQYIDSTFSTRGTIIEFGCGDGTDALALAKQGWTVYASDGSSEGLAVAKSRALENASRGEQVRFDVVDVSSCLDVQDYLESLTLSDSKQPIILMTRFFLHSLNDRELGEFVAGLASAAPGSVSMLHEFRIPEDKSTIKVFGNHRRIYREPEEVISIFAKHFEGSNLRVVKDASSAQYRKEIAVVCRLNFLARKTGSM